MTGRRGGTPRRELSIESRVEQKLVGWATQAEPLGAACRGQLDPQSGNESLRAARDSDYRMTGTLAVVSVSCLVVVNPLMSIVMR